MTSVSGGKAQGQSTMRMTTGTGNPLRHGTAPWSAIALAAALLGGCSSRMAAEDEPTRMPSAPMARSGDRQPAADEPRNAPAYGDRQSIGSGRVWLDDPAKRRGPQGQPAPYGRDTITGRPLSDLQDQPPLPRAGGPDAMRAPSPPAGDRPVAAAAAGSTIVVAKGDTLYGIAQRHGVSINAITRANNLPLDSKIRVGQSLIIPAR